MKTINIIQAVKKYRNNELIIPVDLIEFFNRLNIWWNVPHDGRFIKIDTLYDSIKDNIELDNVLLTISSKSADDYVSSIIIKNEFFCTQIKENNNITLLELDLKEMKNADFKDLCAVFDDVDELGDYFIDGIGYEHFREIIHAVKKYNNHLHHLKDE